jgi:hypothetical protein
LVKFNFHQICLNSFKRVQPNSLFRPNSLFIQPVYQWIRPVYRQNRPVGDFTVQILNQMDFDRFSLNFTEFDRFFWKPAGSEGADFFVSAGFLNTDHYTVFHVHKEEREADTNLCSVHSRLKTLTPNLAHQPLSAMSNTFQCQNSVSLIGILVPTWLRAEHVTAYMKRHINQPFAMEIIMIMSWCIWKERNVWLFSNEDPNVQHCKDSFKSEFALTMLREKQQKASIMSQWVEPFLDFCFALFILVFLSIYIFCWTRFYYWYTQ